VHGRQRLEGRACGGGHQRWCAEVAREHRPGHRLTENGGGKWHLPGLGTSGGIGLRRKEEAGGIGAERSEEAEAGASTGNGFWLRRNEEPGGIRVRRRLRSRPGVWRQRCVQVSGLGHA
jgi:hypothetical protein